MKLLSFSPGKVGALPAYLGYFFLRYPGSLGPEETRTVEYFDTYDRRWSREGKVWTKQGGSLALITPPSLFPSDTDPSAFGLQNPQLLGKVMVAVRNLVFEATDQPQIDGQLVKARGHSWLTLRGEDNDRLRGLVTALTTEGLVPLAPGDGWWVTDKGPAFEPPTRWGSPGTSDPAIRFLVDRLRDGYRVARQYEKGVREDVDTECLHQYRVHLRRVRSLASLGKMWEVVPEWVRFKAVLRILQQKTNELRDLDVLILDLPGLRALMPWDEGKYLEGWESHLLSRRKAEWRLVKAWFESEEHHALSDELSKLFDDLGNFGEPWTAGDLWEASVDKSTRQLKRALKNLGTDPADQDLHELRILTKRLRYTLDSLGDLGPPGPVKTVLSRLKGTQESLGQFQDRSILLGRLKEDLGTFRSQKSQVDLLAFGLLVGILTSDHGNRKIAARKDAKILQTKDFLQTLGDLHGA